MGAEYYRPTLLGGDNFPSKRVLLLDDCENTTLFAGTGTGADWSIANHVDARYHGAQGLAIKTRVTDPAANDSVAAYRFLTPPISGLYVVNFRFSFPDISAALYLESSLSIDRAGYLNSPTFRIYPNSKKFYYLDSTQTEVDVISTPYSCIDKSWHVLQYIIDITTLKYVSANFDHYYASLAGTPFFRVASGNGNTSYLYLRLLAAGAAQAITYIDDIVVSELSLS